MADNRTAWRLDLGAEARADGVRFRVWASKRKRVEVAIEDGSGATFPLAPEGNGYFSGTVPRMGAGSRYRYRLDGGERYPDPCSRFQPEGPHGPSMVVDARAYRWHDAEWRGVRMAGQVIYELHVGTFTREGTLDAAARELPELKRLGVTLVELMPVAEFPGRWNWGYDGVDLYAPAHVYGDTEALKRFVDAAHAVGLGVILDVVYNHLGPDGNYLRAYSDDYFTGRYHTPWGEAINFDGPGSSEVRAFFIGNACYWIAEFHIDGLRLDATQAIYDSSPVHVLAELSQRARAAARPKDIVLIAENEQQQVCHLAPIEKGGYGLDALWNDDFHHAARVALTGRGEAYYSDYRGDAQEFISAVKRGFLFQGQYHLWQRQPKGSAVTTEPASAFVIFTQNHDQVANPSHGDRIHALTTPARYRALTALMLLAPETPMLFMGQEFGATNPFLFFADHGEPELAANIREGRKKFLTQFPSLASLKAQAQAPDPGAAATFERSKLNFSERKRRAQIYLFHQDLLRLRREDPVIAAQARERVDGAVLGAGALALRFFGAEGNDRLLLVNLGADLDYSPASEPLLARVGGVWHLVWSSDDPRYGGSGVINPCHEEGWQLPGVSAVFLSAK
jgi:maltooligosyltrehalose trehalohydrolase